MYVYNVIYIYIYIESLLLNTMLYIAFCKMILTIVLLGIPRFPYVLGAGEPPNYHVYLSNLAILQMFQISQPSLSFCLTRIT